jgi:hypothetical protein
MKPAVAPSDATDVRKEQLFTQSQSQSQSGASQNLFEVEPVLVNGMNEAARRYVSRTPWLDLRDSVLQRAYISQCFENSRTRTTRRRNALILLLLVSIGGANELSKERYSKAWGTYTMAGLLGILFAAVILVVPIPCLIRQTEPSADKSRLRCAGSLAVILVTMASVFMLSVNEAIIFDACGQLNNTKCALDEASARIKEISLNSSVFIMSTSLLIVWIFGTQLLYLRWKHAVTTSALMLCAATFMPVFVNVNTSGVAGSGILSLKSVLTMFLLFFTCACANLSSLRRAEEALQWEFLRMMQFDLEKTASSAGVARKRDSMSKQDRTRSQRIELFQRRASAAMVAPSNQTSCQTTPSNSRGPSRVTTPTGSPRRIADTLSRRGKARRSTLQYQHAAPCSPTDKPMKTETLKSSKWGKVRKAATGMAPLLQLSNGQLINLPQIDNSTNFHIFICNPKAFRGAPEWGDKLIADLKHLCPGLKICTGNEKYGDPLVNLVLSQNVLLLLNEDGGFDDDGVFTQMEEAEKYNKNFMLMKHSTATVESMRTGMQRGALAANKAAAIGPTDALLAGVAAAFEPVAADAVDCDKVAGNAAAELAANLSTDSVGERRSYRNRKNPLRSTMFGNSFKLRPITKTRTMIVTERLCTALFDMKRTVLNFDEAADRDFREVTNFHSQTHRIAFSFSVTDTTGDAEADYC